MFAVVDLETTGLSPKRDKVIEIALILFDGNEIVDEFSTLVNPERVIPSHISRITGITNEMVEKAPKFWEIARDIVLKTEEATFVAHNVNFDYNFIREEFEELGYDFHRDKLCTVKLSRKILPGKKSYSLGKLCKEEGIVLNNRHRAYGDALATAKLLNYLLNLQNARNNKTATSPISSLVGSLPAETGIYYFYNADKEIIYVGKSINIKERVKTHFNDFSGKKNRRLRMLDQIEEVSYELTGSELVALLKESEEIKNHKPIYNQRQRRDSNLIHVITYTDQNGYIRFHTSRKTNLSDSFVSFSTLQEAKNFLGRLSQNYNLCEKLCGLDDHAGACFNYHIHKCVGACIGEESPESYNVRARDAMNSILFEDKNFFIIDKGRNSEEKSVIKIENGAYIGLGYIDSELLNGDTGILHDVIQPYRDNKEVRRLIMSYLSNDSMEAVIPF
mgnify:CR=1 FL=1